MVGRSHQDGEYDERGCNAHRLSLTLDRDPALTD
jgi:hypothetical protein